MERIRHSRHYLIALDDDCCSCKYRPLLLSFDTQTILIYIVLRSHPSRQTALRRTIDKPSDRHFTPHTTGEDHDLYPQPT